MPGNTPISNPNGRRNLSPEQMSLLRGRIYNRSKKSHGAEPGGRGNQYAAVKDQIDPLPTQSTAETLAAKHGVSAPTIKRDGKFAESVEKLESIMPGTTEHGTVANKWDFLTYYQNIW